VFLGGFDVTDYLGPVAIRGREEAVAKELVAAVSDQVGWDRADLRGLADGSPWLAELKAAARANGLEAEEDQDDTAPLIVLPTSFEAYLAALPAKLRHEIRRKRRRLVEETGGYRVAMSTPATMRDDMDRFLELHRGSPDPKGTFMRAGMELFFRRLAERFLPQHAFHLAFLEVEREKVAGAIGLTFGNTFSLYNSAFDRSFGHLSPGMVLVADLIGLAIESGRTTFDLLRGDLAYKYRFGSVPRAVRRLTISRA
jgi:CelD/BcsL family acetyltransferase involved in cellulose biosynthesis